MSQYEPMLYADAHREREIESSMHSSGWRLASTDALAVCGKEFCDGVPRGCILLPGEIHNMGLFQMIQRGSYQELKEGMQTFLLDDKTQDAILQFMRNATELTEYVSDRSKQISNANVATQHRMHVMIAQSVRYHPNNAYIMQNGLAVLSCLGPAAMPHDQVLYIVATLIPLMHENAADPKLQLQCLQTINILTNNEAPTPWIMIGDKNMLNIVMQSMDAHADNTMLAVTGMTVLARFMDFVSVTRDRLEMDPSQVDRLESFLCTVIALYSEHEQVIGFCTGALECLYIKFRSNAWQHERVLHLTLKIMTTFPGVFSITKNSVGLILAMLPAFEGPLPDKFARSSVDAAQVLPTIVRSMMLMREGNDLHQQQQCEMCTVVFRIITRICRNSPENKGVVNSMTLVQDLVNRFAGDNSLLLQPHPEDSIGVGFHKHLAILKTVLASAVHGVKTGHRS